MNDDEVIRQRISGRSARAIAKAQATTVAEVNKALDRFTETTIDDKIRRHTLALELARLDELQETLLRPSPGRRRAVRRSNHENHRTPLHDARPLHAANCNAAGYRSRNAAGNVNGQNQCPHRTHPGQDQGRSGRPAIHPLDTS